MTNNTKPKNNATPPEEPTALEAGAGYVSTLIQEGTKAELVRVSTWNEMADQKAQTVITRGTERGHMRTVVRAKGSRVGEN